MFTFVRKHRKLFVLSNVIYNTNIYHMRNIKTMKPQSKISSFFKPITEKMENRKEDDVPLAKRQKIEPILKNEEEQENIPQTTVKSSISEDVVTVKASCAEATDIPAPYQTTKPSPVKAAAKPMTLSPVTRPSVSRVSGLTPDQNARKKQKRLEAEEKQKSKKNEKQNAASEDSSQYSEGGESKGEEGPSAGEDGEGPSPGEGKEGPSPREDEDSPCLLVNVGESWHKALNSEFKKPYFKKLSSFVSAEHANHTIYPPADQVFSFTNACPIQQVKVVILGQDPYHGPKQAHGLCFSVQKDVPPPPSLVNMYKTLAKDIEGFAHPGHGYLAGWAEQGVLLLNAVLTVRAHNANSHKDKGWEKFTDAVISYVNKNLDGVVFMLWGSYAQKKGAYIDQKRHCVLKSVHPSPLSAHRGFFDCQHFSKCNAYLVKVSKPQIDWKKLPLPK